MEAIVNAITSGLSYINPFSENFILKGIIEFLGSILGYINPFSEDFILKGVLDFLGSILSYINPFSENFILKDVLSFLGSLLDYINPFSENFILKNVLKFLGDMLSYINPFSENFIGYKIIDLLKDALAFLFVPQQSSVDNLVNKVTEKFGFIESIKNAFNDIQNMINNIDNGTAVFSVDISSPWYNGKATLFNLAWYKPFKPYGDLVFTGFAYLFFIWRLYVRLPSIIGGSSGIVKAGRGGDNDN